MEQEINEIQVRKIVREELDKNYRSGAPRVAPHQHNGVDNLKISQSDIIPLIIGNGVVSMTSTGTYYLLIGNIGQTPSSVTFYGGAENTGGGLHSMVVGSAQLGNNQQFKTSGTNAVALSPVVGSITQGSSSFNASGGGPYLLNSQSHIVYVWDSGETTPLAMATVTAYDNSRITVETVIASGWSISGFWTVS